MNPQDPNASPPTQTPPATPEPAPTAPESPAAPPAGPAAPETAKAEGGKKPMLKWLGIGLVVVVVLYLVYVLFL